MKKFIIAIVMLLIPISFVGAENKETVDVVNVKTSMPSEGYLPLPAKHKYYYYKEDMTKETEKADCLDCMEGQRRIISFDSLGAGDEITNPLNEYENKKINASPFSWILIPDIKESQPSGIIQFTYSF
ncbi:MAG: hypothetical protein MUO88_00535 [Desulfobacterales bacterium]|nr:hypothetical protein [Desulfobacterales bacterium]